MKMAFGHMAPSKMKVGFLTNLCTGEVPSRHRRWAVSQGLQSPRTQAAPDVVATALATRAAIVKGRACGADECGRCSAVPVAVTMPREWRRLAYLGTTWGIGMAQRGMRAVRADRCGYEYMLGVHTVHRWQTPAPPTTNVGLCLDVCDIGRWVFIDLFVLTACRTDRLLLMWWSVCACRQMSHREM